MSIKIIKNNKTGREYPVTPDEWEIIKSKDMAKLFTIVRDEKAADKTSKFVPPEIASTKKLREENSKAKTR